VSAERQKPTSGAVVDRLKLWGGRALREPLLHFFLLGATVFLVQAWFGPVETDSRVIRVDDDTLVTYIQYNEKSFAGRAREQGHQLLAAMTPEQRRLLVDAYVREEALYREARALGLDETDYVIRRRLVQTMEYLLEGATSGELPPRSALVSYFDRHRARYASPSTVTFTHVYFAASDGDRAAAFRRAATELARLRSGAVRFEDATRHGDRFPYHANYVDETRELIRSHFGESFASQVFSEAAETDAWSGPFESRTGAHLVLVVARDAGRQPALDDVQPIVAVDYRREQARERQEALARAVIATYRVEEAR
jgi:parvulin-like peptidyl-prolyl isomerase